jgi:predicted small lipoprotein YifL
MTIRLALALTTAAALLCGCGQKGPLYLPPKPGQVVTSGPTPPPAPGSQAQPQQAAPVQPPQNSPIEPPATNPAPQPPPKKPDPDNDSQAPK